MQEDEVGAAEESGHDQRAVGADPAQLRNRMKSGIIVTWPGSIIEASTTAKSGPRPNQRTRDSE